MSDQHKESMLRWYNEVWNNGDENVIDELMHPQAEAFGLGDVPLIGPSEFKPFYKAFNKAYAGINAEVDKVFTDGDYVICLCTIKAIHKATGKPVKFTGTSIARMENGQIMSAWNHFDFLTMHLQTGKIKPKQLV
jgi:predicted ester cyclase